MIKHLITAVCLIALCSACEPPETVTDPSGALWNGTFRVHLYGGGDIKHYDTVYSGTDELFFSLADNEFQILQEVVSCQLTDAGEIPELIPGTGPISYANVGSGTATNEYYDVEDKPVRMYFDDNRLEVNLRERATGWVTLTSTIDGSSDTSTTGCMLNDLYSITFEENEYEFPWVDDQGRSGIHAEKNFDEGTAHMTISLTYYIYDPS